MSVTTSNPSRPNRIVANSVLPAIREPITLTTVDGLRLVGELALPVGRPATATIICLHPLPTAQGMMDSHVLRKAAWRLPALAATAVLRFNTRGTESRAGRSEGEFDGGGSEGLDLAAAIAVVDSRGLPDPWLVGWSFGTDVAIRHGNIDPVQGAVLLSPPLLFSAAADLDGWARSGRPLVAVVPELDDYLSPSDARTRFARVPQAEVVEVAGAKHLWVGERFVRAALDEVVRKVAPAAFPLPDQFDGQQEHWSDL